MSDSQGIDLAVPQARPLLTELASLQATSSDFLSLNTKMNMAPFYYDSVSHIHRPASANTHSASNVYESTAENSPQHMHCLFLFDKRLLENYSAQLFLGHYQAFFLNECMIKI